MIFIIFNLFYRIKEPISEVSYLPKLENEEQLNSFVNSHSTCLIIFLSANNEFSLNFINYGISEYKDKIGFALASSELSKSTLYSADHPVLIGYISGKQVFYNGDSKKSFSKPTVFSTIAYCKYLLGLRTKKLTSPEEIRQILEGNEVAVIGVDRAPKPKNFPKNEIFYETLSALFRHFNINVSSGIYVYRPSDRQLVRVNNKNYKVYTKSYLTDISNLLEKNISHLTDKKYIAGFFMSNDNESLANKEHQILNQLAKSDKYKNDFYFSPIPKNNENLICKIGRFSYFNSPSFVVVETKFLINNVDNVDNVEFSKNAKRWIIFNPKELHDLDYICKFIDSILENKKKSPTLVSEELVDNTSFPYSIPIEMKSNYNNFDQLIETNRNEGNDCFVVFIKENINNYFKIILTIKKMQDLLKDQKVKFLFFDVARNDLPELIYGAQRNNENIEIPFIARFTSKEKATLNNLYFYQSTFDFSEVMNWVSAQSSSNFKLPEFNETAINNDISKQIPKKKKSLSFPNTNSFSAKEQKSEL